ncbi:hypothetical protein [Micromonospora hortensis]|uniref:hypothetical protein n=1 Tax=Micromonospora hortensis TaxID=2911209 RepID=UPI001EE89AE9|nr:hypothetical protein [Micromonospora hortensis]MCG5450809.1 hypothetical protein [Micromonospora hortensis]
MPETAPAAETAGQPAAHVDWHGEFDPERAGRLVAALRSDVAELKDRLAAKDAELGASAGRVAELEGEIRTRDLAQVRADVIRRHQIPEAAAEFVTGETAEDIEANAAKVASAFVATAPEAMPGLPRPALTPGRAANDAGNVYDPREVARRIASSN